MSDQDEPTLTIRISLGVEPWHCETCNSEGKVKIKAISAEKTTLGQNMYVFIACPMCIGFEFNVKNKG